MGRGRVRRDHGGELWGGHGRQVGWMWHARASCCGTSVVGGRLGLLAHCRNEYVGNIQPRSPLVVAPRPRSERVVASWRRRAWVTSRDGSLHCRGAGPCQRRSSSTHSARVKLWCEIYEVSFCWLFRHGHEKSMRIRWGLLCVLRPCAHSASTTECACCLTHVRSPCGSCAARSAFYRLWCQRLRFGFIVMCLYVFSNVVRQHLPHA